MESRHTGGNFKVIIAPIELTGNFRECCYQFIVVRVDKTADLRVVIPRLYIQNSGGDK